MTKKEEMENKKGEGAGGEKGQGEKILFCVTPQIITIARDILVSHAGGRTLVLESPSVVFLGTLAGNWIRSRPVRPFKSVFEYGMQTLQ